MDAKTRAPDKSVYWKTIFLYFSSKTYVDGSFEHPKHMFKLMGKKIITILRS